MTFCFYLRTYEDYRKFENFMKNGKQKFGENWIFSTMEQKPSYMKQDFIEEEDDDDEDFESLLPLKPVNKINFPKSHQVKSSQSQEKFQ